MFFGRDVTEKLACRRRSHDALANCLGINPGDVLINEEDLEALALILKSEVVQQWNEQLVFGKDTVSQGPLTLPDN